jgi:hypothetical protein
MSNFKSELLGKLERIAREEVGHLFFGEGLISEEVGQLCDDINSAIDNFLGQTLDATDLTDPNSLTFLKFTLPSLVEVFLRRQTLR